MAMRHDEIDDDGSLDPLTLSDDDNDVVYLCANSLMSFSLDYISASDGSHLSCSLILYFVRAIVPNFADKGAGLSCFLYTTLLLVLIVSSVPKQGGSQCWVESWLSGRTVYTPDRDGKSNLAFIPTILFGHLFFCFSLWL
jgi:hypothetical protein